MSTLYERIIDLCIKKGVSGSKMCLDLGMSKSTMSELKAGRTKGISTATAQKIASYFGVSVDYILGSTVKKIAKFNGITNWEDAPTDVITIPVDLSEAESKLFALQKEKLAGEGELSENVVIYHRDGKTVKRSFTKEQLALFHAMLDAIPEDPNDNKDL